MKRFTPDMVDRLNAEVCTAEDAIVWASENLYPRVGKASSFGAEDAVLMDMIIKINPQFHFFTLDTGRLPQATHNAIDVARKQYGANITVLFPDAGEVKDMVDSKGLNLFYDSVENRKLCCNIRKVKPMNKVLATLDGWVTGLRRDQTQIRQDASIFQIDKSHDNILKINPIIDWSWDDVWSYIREHNLSYNRLLDEGYPSIGCEPCTRKVRPGEDMRGGRWWWEKGIKECGLHHDV